MLRAEALEGPYAPWKSGMVAEPGIQPILDPSPVPATGSRFYRIQVVP